MHDSILFSRHHTYRIRKRERGSLVPPHHNKWNFHRGPTILKINPLSFRDRSEPPQPISMRGDELPLLTVKTKVASDYSWRHPMTYIRCQSHVILGLVCTYHWNLLWFGSGGSGCVPLAIPLDQKYNSQGAPHVSLRGQ